MEKVSKEVYRVAIIPLSAVGILSSLILLLVWCTKKYKFNRFIMKVIAVGHVCYLCFYHMWFNLTEYMDITASAELAFRLLVTSLYVYLSLTQHFYSKNLLYYQIHPYLMSRKRVMLGLVVVVMWCGVNLSWKEIVHRRFSSHLQLDVLCASFLILTVILPQLMQLYFVVKMVASVRRHSAMLKHKERKADEGWCGDCPDCDSIYFTGRPAAIKHAVAHFSGAQTRVSTGYVSSVSCRVNYRRVLKHVYTNSKLELQTTKAIVAICFLSSFVFILGCLPFAVVRILRSDSTDTFHAIVEVLKFVVFSSHTFILMVMVPSFRSSFMLKIGLRKRKGRVRAEIGVIPKWKMSRPKSVTGEYPDTSSEYTTNDSTDHSVSMGSSSEISSVSPASFGQM